MENANCSYTGNDDYNTAAFPGVLVFARGTLSIAGNVEYQGLIYMANLQNSTGLVLTLGGNSLVSGSVAVDGNGGVAVGESKENLSYDPNAADPGRLVRKRRHHPEHLARDPDDVLERAQPSVSWPSGASVRGARVLPEELAHAPRRGRRVAAAVVVERHVDDLRALRQLRGPAGDLPQLIVRVLPSEALGHGAAR